MALTTSASSAASAIACRQRGAVRCSGSASFVGQAVHPAVRAGAGRDAYWHRLGRPRGAGRAAAPACVVHLGVNGRAARPAGGVRVGGQRGLGRCGRSPEVMAVAGRAACGRRVGRPRGAGRAAAPACAEPRGAIGRASCCGLDARERKRARTCVEHVALVERLVCASRHLRARAIGGVWARARRAANQRQRGGRARWRPHGQCVRADASCMWCKKKARMSARARARRC